MVDPDGLEAIVGEQIVKRAVTTAVRAPLPPHVKVGIVVVGGLAVGGGSAASAAGAWSASGAIAEAEATAAQLAAKQAARRAAKRSAAKVAEDECKKKRPWALGRTNGLAGFAAKTNADYLSVNRSDWEDIIFEKLEDPHQRIYVNMEDISEGDVDRARNTKYEFQTPMERELTMIRKGYGRYRKRIFWYNGDNPYESGYHERGVK